MAVYDVGLPKKPDPPSIVVMREGDTKAPETGNRRCLHNVAEALKAVDKINHPPHYTASGIEPIDVIESWNLGFCLGNTVKYIARAKHKGSELEDLKKARWYLDREIAAKQP